MIDSTFIFLIFCCLPSPTELVYFFSYCTVVVELLKDNYIVDSREIPASAFKQNGKDGSIPIEFAIGADTLGNHTLSVRAKIVEPASARSIEGEVNLANNIRTTMIEVVEETKLRVLFYSQVVSFDIGKVRQALARNDKIDLALALEPDYSGSDL